MDEDIVFYIGNDRDIQFTFYDTETGGPLDITGCSFLLSVKEREVYTSYLIQQAGELVGLGTLGVVKFVLESSDTAGLRPGKYVYDIQMTDASDNVITIVKSVFELALPVTT